MTAENPALADLLEREGPAAEPADVLAALVAGGVIIAIDESESVIFIRGEDDKPWLPTFVDGHVCARDVPHGRPYPCDASRLLDIAARTGVRTLTVASATQCATIPMMLIAKALSAGGPKTD
ncbi:hypothetical protein [Streptomyces sp. SID3343]|uniref:hypothetical protein n=1 Tax=Streptomyces sp. SID3343 TaxID=2690260 RepID=UPI0013695CB9|nr:hypothetical protein [Streptomyces sp. SID3343]MYV97108.1 hypothetical protein [Streptomyces sp. SID3343]